MLSVTMMFIANDYNNWIVTKGVALVREIIHSSILTIPSFNFF